MRVFILLVLLLSQAAWAQSKSTWDSSRGSTVTLEKNEGGQFTKVTIRKLDGTSATHLVKTNYAKSFSFQSGGKTVDARISGVDAIRLSARGSSKTYRWTKRGGQAERPVPNTSTCKKTLWIQGAGGNSVIFLSSPKAASLHSVSKIGKKIIERSYACEWVDYPRTLRDKRNKLITFFNPWLMKHGAIYRFRYHRDYGIK